jgi:hypothetical protein
MDYSKLEQLPNFPCLSCPFLRKIENKGNVFPFCLIYSSQEVVGLESCQEVFVYLEKHGSRMPESKEIIIY